MPFCDIRKFCTTANAVFLFENRNFLMHRPHQIFDYIIDLTYSLITWMCRPVSVPAHPRILAGRWFLQISPNISPNISGEQGVAGFPEILAKLVHDSLKKIYFMKFLTNLRAQRGKIFKYIFDFSWVFLQKFLTTRNKLARAARKNFEYIIHFSSFHKEILYTLARAARENF